MRAREAWRASVMTVHPKIADTDALLAALTAARVEFIVVGGTAAQLHGSTMTTLDLDIVHRRTPENVERFLGALNAIEARARYDLANRDIRPTAAHLLGSGQINLSTTLGPLDPLCELAPGQGYDELLAHTVIMRDGDLSIRVLDIPTLIDVKSKVGRGKDKLVVADLIAILEAKRDEEAR